MQRRPEPELMDDPAQAQAYAQADFTEPHERFVALFREHCTGHAPRQVLDLGCGPGDICRRFARAYPSCEIHGLDGAQAMLEVGQALLDGTPEAHRIRLLHRYLPQETPPLASYDTVISNSLLHHLEDPMALWQCIDRYCAAGGAVFVMDLLRPADEGVAHVLVERYSGGEPDLLKRDFFHSLCAAYRADEVAEQLCSAGLGWLRVEVVSDRHWIAFGRRP